MRLVWLSVIMLIGCKGAIERRSCDYITDYFPHVYEAELAFQDRKYQRASEYYQKAFENCKPVNTVLYYEMLNYAEVCARLGRNQECLQFIMYSIDEGYELQYWLEDSLFREAFNSQEGKKLIADYPKLRSDYELQVNRRLRSEIHEMMHTDQMYRNNGYKQLKQDSIDRINTKKLIEIFEEIGYPNNKNVGHYSLDHTHTDIGTILLHTEDSIRLAYFVPKLIEFVRSGQCNPLEVGRLLDQYQLYNGQPQTHGTYQSQEGGLAPMIPNLGVVNKNRIGIGLPSLQLQAKIDSLRRVNYQLP